MSRIWQQILSYVLVRQWIILAATEIDATQPFWKNFTPIFPPSDRSWADPFIWVQDGKYYLFVEEILCATNRGRIACLSLDDRLKPVSNSMVLERPYHLSYPFLFEYENQIYMLPETKRNGTIELYRCVDFPSQWAFEMTLMTDVNAVDSTLVHASDTWWLFSSMPDSRKRGTNALYLYYADTPLSSHWTPHPQNPIVTDPKFARPAGRIYARNGSLIRPSQDCSTRYGYAVNFSRITSLSESRYEEVHERTIEPPRNTNVLAAHTWNEMGGLQITDALLYWWKLRHDGRPVHRQWRVLEDERL